MRSVENSMIQNEHHQMARSRRRHGARSVLLASLSVMPVLAACGREPVLPAQLLESNSFISQIVGGGSWITSVTITNTSATESVEGIAKFFDTAAMAAPESVIDPTIPFWIPPSGSVTLNTHNQGALTVGFARTL